MYGKIIAVTFAVLYLFSISLASADLPITVKISPEIERALEYYNFKEEIENGFQKFETSIYNVGSVGCLTRLRFDIYNASDDKLVHSCWSANIPLEAGAYDDFEAYWYPYNISGRFYSKMRIYQCHDIFEGPVSEFFVNNTVNNVTKKTDWINQSILEVKKVSDSDNQLELEFKANSDLEDIIVYADEYPFGWVFENGEIKKINNNEIKYLTINFEPSIFHKSKIKLNIFDKKNNYFSSLEFYLEKNNKINQKDLIIWILGIVIFLLTFLNIRQIKKRKIKEKK